jgi:hypothetical protein
MAPIAKFFYHPERSDGIAGAESKDRRAAIRSAYAGKSLRVDSSLRQACARNDIASVLTRTAFDNKTGPSTS